MRRFSLFVSLFAAGCASLRHGSRACRPTLDSAAESAAPPSPTQIDGLAGHFRITQVRTSSPGDEWVTEITLSRVDSAQREVAKQRRRFGPIPRQDLRLAGTWHWSPRYHDGPSEWDAGILYLGCRDCTDASPDELQISAIDAGGFRGKWRNPQTGIVHEADERGRPLPDPAGYFCAVRLEQ